MIEIIKYNSSYHDSFRELNRAWLDKYNLMEEFDMAVLNDPQAMILDSGGYIWLAMDGDVPVGSAALIKEHDGVYELAKMTVAPAYRGQGISNRLMEVCLDKARELGATKLSLYSNHQLVTALKLYEKYGFRHVPVVDSPFVTADVQMELEL